MCNFLFRGGRINGTGDSRYVIYCCLLKGCQRVINPGREVGGEQWNKCFCVTPPWWLVTHQIRHQSRKIHQKHQQGIRDTTAVNSCQLRIGIGAACFHWISSELDPLLQEPGQSQRGFNTLFSGKDIDVSDNTAELHLNSPQNLSLSESSGPQPSSLQTLGFFSLAVCIQGSQSPNLQQMEI